MTGHREVVERWFASLGPSALRRYRVALTQFATWATGELAPSPDVALRVLVAAGRAGARGMVCAWRDELLAKGKATATVAANVSALASCCTAARLAGLIEWGIEKVAPKIEQRHDRSGPPRHEVERLLGWLDDKAKAIGRRALWAIRDVSIVRLLHNAALRRFEVTGLRLCDVQLDHLDGPRVLALRKGKREREPMLIGSLAAASLRHWLEIRGTTKPTAPLFVRLHALQDAETAGSLSGEAIRQMLRQRATEAGLLAACRPHGLRHSAATRCEERGNLAALVALGGWMRSDGPAPYLDGKQHINRNLAVAVVQA